MAIEIVSGDLASDRARVVAMLARDINPSYDESRFDWLYRDNPFGRGRLWIALDAATRTLVGAAGAFPRRIYVGDREEVVWVLGDFCVDTRYRSIGPALQLQRACLTAVDCGTVPFSYDFPSRAMMAIYRRLQIEPLGSVVRLTRILRVDKKMLDRVRSSALARGLSATANLLLAPRLLPRSSRQGTTIALHEGECGHEFTALAKEVAGSHGVCVQRSAEYLNWRYRANPVRHHELLTARHHGALAAYAVFTQHGDESALVDLFGLDASALGDLLRTLVNLLWRRGAATISTSLFHTHPWITVLRRQGFRAREQQPVVVYPGSLQHSVAKHSAWLLMDGDRDS